MFIPTSISRILLVTLCILTVGVTAANADSVKLSNGGFVSGGAVYMLTTGDSPIGLDLSVPWTVTSTTGAVWTNLNVSTQAAGTTNGSQQGFPNSMFLEIFHDFGNPNGTSTRQVLGLFLPETLPQFVQQLQALPFLASFQLPVLTGCNVADLPSATCSGELDQVATPTTPPVVTFNTYAIVGPAFLTITNDPGHYVTTLTSVPLNAVPEPSSLFLVGSGLVCLRALKRKKADRA